MPRRSWIVTLATITIVACSAAGTATNEGSAAAPPPGWKKTMHHLGDHFEIASTEFDKRPVEDLRAIADAAWAGAELVRHGYGKFQKREVKDFARMARDAESWLLRIAAEAGQGHGTIAHDLYQNGEARYCTRYHDASKATKW